MPADQFSVRVKRAGKVFTQVLSVDDGKGSEALRGWAWGMRPSVATYHALFPRAWTVYEVRSDGVDPVSERIWDCSSPPHTVKPRNISPPRNDDRRRCHSSSSRAGRYPP